MAVSCVLQWLEGAEPARVEKTIKELGVVPEVLTCITPHPRSDLLLLGTNTGRIVFWNPVEKAVAGAFQAHDQDVTRILFSPAGDKLLTGSLDGQLGLWDEQFGQIHRISAGGQVFAAAWSPSGRMIAGGGKGKFLTVWDANSAKPAYQLTGSSDDVASCAFLSDKMLISAGASGILRAWEIEATRSIRSQQAHSQHIVQVLVSPSGTWYATASWDKTVKVWNLQHKTKFALAEGSQAITAITLTKDERLLAAAYWDGSVRIWNMDSGDKVDEFQAHDSSQVGCGLVDGDKFLVTADQAGNLRAWDMAEMGVERYHNKHGGEVYSVQYTPDNLKIVSTGYDGQLKIWDRAERRETGFMCCHDGPATACAVSRDGRLWATGSAEGAIKVWDVEQQNLDCTLSAHRHLVSTLVFPPYEGKLVSSSWDLKVRFWSVETQLTECVYEGHSKEVDACDVSLDGRRIVSVGWDRTARIWNLADRRGEIGKELAVLTGHTERLLSCAYHPAGTFVATGSSDHTVRVWATEKRSDCQILDGHVSEVSACRYTPDGNVLLSCDRSGIVIAWDTVTGERLASLEHGTPILALAIAPDGQEAVIGDQFGRVRFLALDYGAGPPWVPASTFYETQKSFWTRVEKSFERHEITCPFCGNRQRMEREQLGQEWKCSQCSNSIMVCPMPTPFVET